MSHLISTLNSLISADHTNSLEPALILVMRIYVGHNNFLEFTSIFIFISNVITLLSNVLFVHVGPENNDMSQLALGLGHPLVIFLGPHEQMHTPSVSKQKLRLDIICVTKQKERLVKFLSNFVKRTSMLLETM
jgi:hypothetical protein